MKCKADCTQVFLTGSSPFCAPLIYIYSRYTQLLYWKTWGTSSENYKITDKRTEKRTAGIAVLFREGISFLWGIAKNYIMYWGVTSSIIADPLLLVNT